MCVALGMEEGAPELDVDEVKDWILLSTWVGCPAGTALEPVETAVHIALGGCVTTTAEVYAGGSEIVSEWQSCDFAKDCA